jgi:hypothetical protein
LNIILRAVPQINEGLQHLKSPLKEIMTWPKGENGVQRGNVTAACGEVEKVRIAVLD